MSRLPDFLLKNEEYQDTFSFKGTSTAFIDKTIQKLAQLVQLNHHQQHPPLKIAVSVRLILFFYFILVISFLHSIALQLIIGVVILVMHLAVNKNVIRTFRRIILFTFLFGFLIALPSSLNVITRGEVILPLLQLERPHQFLIYHIPQVIGFTAEGVKGMSLLTLRVFNSVSISFLLISITPFNDIIKGLKIFRLPDTLLMIITLSYLYIFILANSVAESYLAMKSRIIGHMDNKDVQQLVAGRITHIFKMSRRHFEKTYQAMLARGYAGEVVLHQREKLALADYLLLGAAFLFGLSIFIFQIR